MSPQALFLLNRLESLKPSKSLYKWFSSNWSSLNYSKRGIHFRKISSIWALFSEYILLEWKLIAHNRQKSSLTTELINVTLPSNLIIYKRLFLRTLDNWLFLTFNLCLMKISKISWNLRFFNMHNSSQYFLSYMHPILLRGKKRRRF